MKRKFLIIGLAAIFTVFMFTGCSSSNGSSSSTGSESVSSSEESSVSEEDALADLPVIGVRTEGENTYAVGLTNQTGKNITGFTIKDTEAAEYPDNMLPDGETYAAGEERALYYSPENQETTADSDSQTSSGSSTEAALEPQYEAKVTFEDGTESTWHAIPFGDMEEGSLNLEGTVIYVTYISTTTGENVNTLESEKAAADAEAAAQESSSASGTSSSGSSSDSSDKSSGSSSSGSSSGSSSSGSSSGSSSSGSSSGSSGSGSSGSSSGSSNGSSSSGGSSGSSSGSGSSGGSSSGSDNSSGGSDDSGCIGDDGLVY